MRLSPVLGAAVLIAGSLASCSGTDPVGYDFQKEEGDGELGTWIHSGFYNREYELHTPPGMSQDGSHPMIVFLHGEGDTGPAFRRRLRPDAVTDPSGFITVWPSGLEGTWTVGCAVACTLAEALGADDVRFLQTLVRGLAVELPVDTAKVYVLGYSQGGQLAQLFGCQSDLVPAGIGTVAGAIYRSTSVLCAPRGPFYVGVVHGDEDPISYFTGFGPGAVVMSVPETVDHWLDFMGCGGAPSLESRPDTAGDYTSATVYRFPGCMPGAAMSLYQVHEGGHNWPGDTGPWPVLTGPRSRSVDATWELLDLFRTLEPRAAGN